MSEQYSCFCTDPAPEPDRGFVYWSSEVDRRFCKYGGNLQVAAYTSELSGNTMTETTNPKKAKPEKYNTIGVRFPESPGKEYTYKVRIGAKPYLGQELIADTSRGQAVVFVTRIDKTPQQTFTFFGPELKYIDRKAVAL